MRLLFIPLIAAIVIQPCFASKPSETVIAEWFKMNHATIAIDNPGSADKEIYNFDIAPNQDVRVRVSSIRDGKPSDGTMMLIEGQMLLVQNVPLVQGEEIDAMDGAAVILQLVDQLLAAGTRKSPDKLHGKSQINISEKSWTIKVGTMSASGEYPPPWQLAGSIEAESSGSVSYDLTYTSLLKEKVVVEHYIGKWEKSATSVTFDDAMPLVGWQIFKIGPITIKSGSSTILDYGATRLNQPYKTLGELRKSLQKD